MVLANVGCALHPLLAHSVGRGRDARRALNADEPRCPGAQNGHLKRPQTR